VSKKETNGTRDILAYTWKKDNARQDENGNGYHMETTEKVTYNYEQDYTRQVDPEVFERPEEFCYDANNWY
jgi:hypothetical protein